VKKQKLSVPSDGSSSELECFGFGLYGLGLHGLVSILLALDGVREKKGFPGIAGGQCSCPGRPMPDTRSSNVD
jgi:hypothetical protein